MYRVAREALQNVRKHAGAERVRVAVESTGDGAVLTVTDDGCGFDPGGAPAGDRAGGHVGLRLMGDAAQQGRATLTVTSAPGSGTTVRLEVPAS